VLKLALESNPLAAPVLPKPPVSKKKPSTGKVLVTSRKGVSV